MALFDATFPLRLRGTDKDRLKDTCDRFKMDPADLVREMIVAVNEGRLKISVPEDQLLIIKGLHYVD